MENTTNPTTGDGTVPHKDDAAHLEELLDVINGDPANETVQAPDDDGSSLPELLGSGKFESAEHQAIGNAVQLIADKNAPPIPATSLKLCDVSAYAGVSGLWGNKNIELYFGRVVGLAGDYYTTNDKDCTPISNLADSKNPNPRIPDPPYSVFNPQDTNLFATQRNRFSGAVDSLIKDSNQYLYFVFGSLDKEVKAMDEVADEASKDQNTRPENQAQAYHRGDHGIPGTVEFLWDTSLKYATIAWTNFDHFHLDAVTSYGVGHSLALDRAKIAGQQSDAGKRQSMLKIAYLTEAFAAHYLTDLFSTGHTRPPRRQLHNTNYYMAGLQAKTPVNDNQAHFAHDDDSATGLLVRNATGVEWIAYGDKQLFLPHSRLNLYYAVQGINAGVQEVIGAFNTGTMPKPSEYAALKTIPSPQPAYASTANKVKGTSPDRYFDSGSPLWVYDSDADKFTIRPTINDHSDFGTSPLAKTGDRRTADPRSDNSDTQAINKASFQGNDQFPYTKQMVPFTGGFVQLQVLPLDDPISSWQVGLNAFGLIDLPDVLKPGSRTKCFTLRTRGTMLTKGSHSDTKQTVPLQWCRSNSGDKTSLILFTQERNKTSGANDLAINCTSVSLIAQGSTVGSQEVKLETASTHTLASGGTDFENFTFCTQSSQSSANLMRFFSSSSLASGTSSASNPALASIGWQKQDNGSYAAQLSVAVTASGGKSPSLITPASGWVDTDQRAAGDIDGVFKSSSSLSSFVHVTIPKEATKPAKISREWWVEGGNSIIAASPQSAALPVSVVAVLAGKVVNLDGDQLVVISGSWPNYDITIYKTTGAGQPWTQHANLVGSSVTPKWTASDTNSSNNVLQGAKFNSICFTALVPRYQEQQQSGAPAKLAGNNILMVSSVTTKAGVNVLNFRTYLPDSSGNNFATLRDSVVPVPSGQVLLTADEFHGNQNYFNVAWLRATAPIGDHGVKTENAVLEVFSYYGITGTRMWAPSFQYNLGKVNDYFNDFGPYVYSLVGQCPYMGTPSIGSGLGCTNRWNQGVLLWGDVPDWVDYFDGTEVVRADDERREQVPGWQVKKRPGYPKS